MFEVYICESMERYGVILITGTVLYIEHCYCGSACKIYNMLLSLKQSATAALKQNIAYDAEKGNPKI
jgi:hypothetical protein